MSNKKVTKGKSSHRQRKDKTDLQSEKWRQVVQVVGGVDELEQRRQNEVPVVGGFGLQWIRVQGQRVSLQGRQ